MSGFLLCISGCRAPDIRPPDPTLNEANSATLEIYRPTALAKFATDYRVYLNEEYIGLLRNGGEIIRRVSPGKKQLKFRPYELGIPGFGTHEATIEAVTGFRYYVRMDSEVDELIPAGNMVYGVTSTNIRVVKRPIGDRSRGER